ncbi:molybdenum ABC transporter ATP-binding protein [Paracoccus shanxieyensis]|uniref:Molybdenum ABC transporter ATP-binding protein n=1 Tax=Paracoccus shanxieyensis TaxID=2675752 RepID=A0A6L6IZW7_9RHOB|nr:molybdenum ABC transporter ATP-binding protein [Paracoccus shanxieyensis]MTH65823.1 molybdenum ABC transporter ATP-binding protein [Paracoccus shanxieyensis]MTH89135.1 molybdenum ABC transporter ATP-binding protein [Paracoccus shanxieyensis]
MSLSVAYRHAFPGLALDVSFDAPGGITALFGPSGCGKSTTIAAISGLMRPDQGRIVLNDRVLYDAQTNLRPQVRRIGCVFQDARLFPHMTVAKNLRYPSRWRRGAAQDFGRVVDLLGLGQLLDRRPGTLSGGERQRVAIGRALLSDPALLVMDEPLAALDDSRKAEIMPWLERLRDQVRLPILYVSHSVPEVLRLATTVVLMDKGRVTHAGPLTQILSDPDLAPRLGTREAGALLTATVQGRDPDGMTRVMTAGGPMLLQGITADIGTVLRLRVLAHEVILSRDAPQGLSALNILPATVLRVDGGLVQLALGDERMLAQITPRSVEALDLKPGTACHAIVKSVSVLPS